MTKRNKNWLSFIWLYSLIFVGSFVIICCGDVTISGLEPVTETVNINDVTLDGIERPLQYGNQRAYPKFYVEVYPILENSFCTLGCHTAVGKENNGNLDLSNAVTAYNELTDNETVSEDGFYRVDISTPEKSLLLIIPLIEGQDNKRDHGGGDNLWTTESSDYLTILEWIQWLSQQSETIP